MPPTWTAFTSVTAPPFWQLNAIFFKDFTVSTGDTEGRLVVGGNFKAGNGYSVGDKVVTTGANKNEDPATYSLIVDGNASWGSGSLGPFAPNPSLPEGAYVGGTVNFPGYLAAQVNDAGVLAAAVANDLAYALGYYSQVSIELAALATNAQASVTAGQTLTVTCNSAVDGSYVVNVDAATLNTITSYAFVSCNAAAQYIFNVIGTADLTFTGNNIGGQPNILTRTVTTLWNIVGNNRAVNVQTGVYGHILNPNGPINQQNGVINGFVIGSSYNAANSASQINQPRCPTPPPYNVNPPPPPVCPYFEDDSVCSTPLSLGNTYATFKDFNLVSFGDFNADTGDVQGRVIVQGNFKVGNGYSIGASINTINGKDHFLPYSVIVGGNANWGSGAIFPDVSPPAPNQGAPEGIFVGGTFTAPSYLLLKQTPLYHLPNLNNDFANALTCYNKISSGLSILSQNVQTYVQYLALNIVCTSSQAQYVINTDDVTLNSITYYTLSGCNAGARWVINVAGNGAVNFQGASFPALSGGVVYNILGAGRTINVQTQVNGNILAPKNIYNQNGGVTVGKVVVGSCQHVLQVNIPNCPVGTVPVTITNTVGQPGNPGDNKITCNSHSDLQRGDDLVTSDGHHYTVSSVNGNIINLGSPLTNSVAVGSTVTVTVPDMAALRFGSTGAAASVVASTFLIIAALVALLI